MLRSHAMGRVAVGLVGARWVSHPQGRNRRCAPAPIGAHMYCVARAHCVGAIIDVTFSVCRLDGVVWWWWCSCVVVLVLMPKFIVYRSGEIGVNVVVTFLSLFHVFCHVLCGIDFVCLLLVI